MQLFGDPKESLTRANKNLNYDSWHDLFQLEAFPNRRGNHPNPLSLGFLFWDMHLRLSNVCVPTWLL
jgi:hypothetical protein